MSMFNFLVVDCLRNEIVYESDSYLDCLSFVDENEDDSYYECGLVIRACDE